MSEAVFNLDREMQVKNNVDAFGKKWEIKQKRGSALYFAVPNPYRSDFVCPKYMVGLWTKVELLQEQIRKHVDESWDKSDKAKAEADRKAEALKESQARAQALKEAQIEKVKLVAAAEDAKPKPVAKAASDKRKKNN